MRPLRLTAVTHNLNHEGAPLVLFELVRELAASGVITPTLVSMSEGPLRAEYERLGFPVRVLRAPLLRYRGAWFFARRSSEVILANTILAWWAVDAARIIGRPSLWLIHESEPAFSLFSSARTRAGARRALGDADRVVFPADATRAVYRDLDPRARLSTFHNGFDRKSYDARVVGRSRAAIRERLELPADQVVGVVVGTVSPRKSQLDAVLAIAELPLAVASRLTLFVIGDVPGSYSEAVHAAARALPRGTIRIVRYASDVLDFYLAADFALSTSRMEAFPKFVQEAMHFGLPLVVAPVFGIAEQVEDETSALFYPAGDISALAAQLARVVESAELRNRLGRAARNALLRLPSMDDMVRQYAEWIREAWRNDRARRA